MSQLGNNLIPGIQGGMLGGGTFPGAVGSNQFQGLGSSIPGADSLASNYQSAYQAALSNNQNIYSNVIGAYGQLGQNQLANQQNINAGYGQLGGQIAQTLGQGGGWGVAAPAAQAIGMVYGQQTGVQPGQAGAGVGGQIGQDTMNRGVYNTSADPNQRVQAQYGAANAYGALGAQLAQTYAGYQSQIGMSQLNYANQANMQNTGLGQNQANFMASVQAPYPNAQSYQQLLQQLGATNQANQDRQIAAQQIANQQQLANAQVARANVPGVGGIQLPSGGGPKWQSPQGPAGASYQPAPTYGAPNANVLGSLGPSKATLNLNPYANSQLPASNSAYDNSGGPAMPSASPDYFNSQLPPNAGPQDFLMGGSAYGGGISTTGGGF